MNSYAILYPIFAMFLMVQFLLLRLLIIRTIAVSNKTVRLSFYKIFKGGDETERMVATSRNVANLFEVPIFFYVGLILVFLTNSTDTVFLVLAWIYVGLRVLHTLIHVTFNHVQTRLAAYVTSNFVLLALWIYLFTKLNFGVFFS